MKKKYEKPVAIFDEFVSNQFIASCEQIVKDKNLPMNCVNPNHYLHKVDYANTNNNHLHIRHGKNSNSARIYNVFTSTANECGTIIPFGSKYSEARNPTSGPVYPFNMTGAMDYNVAEEMNYCFGAYINPLPGQSTSIQPFSA